MADITIKIPDAWTSRLEAALRFQLEEQQGHPLLSRILSDNGITDVSTLTASQVFKIMVRWDQMTRVLHYEERIAAEQAAQQAVSDIQDNFPGDV